MKRFFLPILFTIILLGILFPGGEALKPILPILLGTLLFFNFYNIDIRGKHFFRQEIVIYFVIVLGILPALVVMTTKFLPSPFQLGIFLTTISPAAVSGSIVVGMIGGSLELSIANTVIFNLLSPLSYTILTKLYFDTTELNVSSAQIIVNLVLMIGIPFGASLICKRLSSLSRPLRILSSYINILFVLIVFMAISSSSKQLRTIPIRELGSVIGMTVLIVAIFYTLGLLLGKDDRTKRALAVNMGQKNNSLCIWLALSSFGPLAAIPATVYIIIQHIFNSLLIFLFTRR
ncbi:sodium Bile acid symporter family protein [Candidatus Vecturithrix granuli]|uniref:Sodium Bile acid symporter family protein n=1 Tax=Vecturithrix granuli TaxID=1499967 RepID=A0A081BYN9_VECG1|nr:sodium Bile acid symporter family protein [Candidatus Vecturithrix granuli]